MLESSLGFYISFYKVFRDERRPPCGSRTSVSTDRKSTDSTSVRGRTRQSFALPGPFGRSACADSIHFYIYLINVLESLSWRYDMSYWKAFWKVYKVNMFILGIFMSIGLAATAVDKAKEELSA